MTNQQLKQIKIRKPDENIRKKVQENWDSLAKPLDGLGIFEKIFMQIGAVTGDESVPIQKKAVIVMCADNGIVEEGISQSGQEVTYQYRSGDDRSQRDGCRRGRTAGYFPDRDCRKRGYSCTQGTFFLYHGIFCRMGGI